MTSVSGTRDVARAGFGSRLTCTGFAAGFAGSRIAVLLLASPGLQVPAKLEVSAQTPDEARRQVPPTCPRW